ncbi:MAG: flagellar motor switch protein FliN [Elusimicrobiota bacterium]
MNGLNEAQENSEIITEIKENEKKTESSRNGVKKMNPDFLMDVPVEISVEVGRIKMPFKEVVSLESGSVININKSPQEPMIIYANGKAVGKGEMVMIDDFVGVRITSFEKEEKNENQ